MASRLLCRGLRLNSLIGQPRIPETLTATVGVLQTHILQAANTETEKTSKRHARGTKKTQRIILHKEVIDRFNKEQLEKDELSRNAEEPLITNEDMPIQDLANPYEKPPKTCVLCKHNIPLDYKNTRLLSQFVSPYTGRIYGRHITGLCLFMQKRVSTIIKRAQVFGLMAYELKDPKYLKDPKLFDPFKRV